VALTNRGAARYTIGDRDFTSLDLMELVQWRDRLKAEVEYNTTTPTYRSVAKFKGPS